MEAGLVYLRVLHVIVQTKMQKHARNIPGTCNDNKMTPAHCMLLRAQLYAKYMSDMHVSVHTSTHTYARMKQYAYRLQQKFHCGMRKESQRPKLLTHLAHLKTLQTMVMEGWRPKRSEQ
eukprot:1152588-Pelagomonas_calceolata.AAC.6